MAFGTNARRLLTLSMLAPALAGPGCGRNTVREAPASRPPAPPPMFGAAAPGPSDPSPRIAQPPVRRAASDPPPEKPAVPAAPPPPELPPASTQARPDPPPADAHAELRRLYRQAAERAAGLDSYYARLRRRETVQGKDKPEEVILFKFRKEPWSVAMKWIGTEGQGRELVYVRGRHDNKLHVLLTKGDNLLMAGKRMAFALDDPMVKDASRHAITEAGLGALVDRFGALLAALDKGDKRLGTATYLGPQKRPELPGPLEGVEQVIPAGAESYLPNGGRRLWFFDAKERLPLLVLTKDERGREVEYYCYDQLQCNVKLDDDDFNPAKLGAAPKK